MAGSGCSLAENAMTRASWATMSWGGPFGHKSWWTRRATPFFPCGSIDGRRWYWPKLATCVIQWNSWRDAPVGLNSLSATTFGRVGNNCRKARRVCPYLSLVMEGPPRL